jgi:hypothetical protein
MRRGHRNTHRVLWLILMPLLLLGLTMALALRKPPPPDQQHASQGARP